MKKLFKRMLVRAFEKVEDIKKNIIGTLYLGSVEYYLRKKRPMRVINRQGYRFEVKSVGHIISTHGDNVVLGEYAGVYHKHSNTFIIGLDKNFRNLDRLTKRFILEHEIAHITHDLHNPSNNINVETQVDLIAASKLGLTKKQLKRCLRDTQRKAKYIASKRVLKERIKNIK